MTLRGRPAYFVVARLLSLPMPYDHLRPGLPLANHPEDRALDESGAEDYITIPLEVGRAGHGYRLDRYLGIRFERLSRARIHQMIAEGRVQCQKSRQPLRKKSMRMCEGMRLWVHRPAPRDEEPLPPFSILHEDAGLLVIDKAAGVPVQPTARQFKSSLPGQLRARFGEEQGWEIAHRLDRETSGVMLLGQAKGSASQLKMAFEARKMDKCYLALMHGELKRAQWVCAPIGPAIGAKIRIKMGVVPVSSDGQGSKTYYLPIKVGQFRSLPVTWALAFPHTGRTHQIRVHAEHLGLPLVGDKLYGIAEEKFIEVAEGRRGEAELAQELGMPYQALHAWQIRFDHPLSGERMQMRAPLPERMQLLEHCPTPAELEQALTKAPVSS